MKARGEKRKNKNKTRRRGLVCLTSFEGKLKAALPWKPKGSFGVGVSSVFAIVFCNIFNGSLKL